MSRVILILTLCLLCTIGGSVDISEREDIQRIDVAEGETLSLTCKARPTLLRSYRWVYIRKGTRKPRVLSSGRRLVVGEPRLSIDAQPGDGHVNLILNLKEIRPYEAGLFMCWRQGLKPDPQVYVRVTEVGMQEAEPISIAISAPTKVDYGSSVKIECLIRPSWPGKVLWIKNGEKILSTDRYYTQHVEENASGETLASLTVVSVREGANYTCRVPSQPEAEASFNLGVRVAKIESLRSVPSKEAIEYGQNLTIECIVSETDSKILWFKDGGSLDIDVERSSPRKIDDVLDNNNMRSTLIIENFSLKDNGQYSCYVPGDSKGFLINIEGRLPRVLEVKGWDFVVGDVLRLTCSTQYAKGEKKVTWLFKGETLRSDWWAEEVIREDVHNITHHDLSLPIPTRAHVGAYTCTAPFGSASAIVREIVPPYIEESPPVSIEIPLGDKLSLPCSVVGYPIPTVLWEKNINGQWKIVEEAKTEGEVEVEDFEVQTIALLKDTKTVGERQELLLDEAMPIHDGKYRCRGYNEKESVSVETEVSTHATASVLNVTAEEVMEGDLLKITCVVSNFEGMVNFANSLRLLGKDGDDRYTVHHLSKEEVATEITGNDGRKFPFTEIVNTYVLIVTNVSLTDQGYYECHAGSEASGSVIVMVKPLPPEIIEVAVSPAVEGGEFFVSCTITHMPTEEKAVFYFAGNNLNEDSSGRYSIHLAELTGEIVIDSKGRAAQATYVLKVSGAHKNDSGVYHCVVGSEAKGSVTVEVQETVEEVFLEASPSWVGGYLVLKCSVINWDKEVAFFLNQTLLLGEDDSRYSLRQETDGNKTVHILNIFDVTEDDSGLYQCFTSPITLAEVNVTVQSLSDLSVGLNQIPKNEPLWVNSNLVLECNLKGFKDYQHTVEFSHNGRPYLYIDTTIPGAQVNERASFLRDEEGESVPKGDVSYRMKLKDVETTEAGTWVCRATLPEAVFAQEAFIIIDIYEPPRFTESPDSEINVEYGSDVLLNCIAAGFPIPKVTWYMKDIGKPVLNGTGSARLEISNFTENNTGSYVCEAKSLDHVISSETKLDIIKEIKIIEMPESETFVTEGSKTVLRCMALSFPPSENPFVTWTKNGSQHVLASDYEMATLAIDSAQFGDEGEYICTAATSQLRKTIATTLIVRQIVSSTMLVVSSTTPAPSLMPERLVELSGPTKIETGRSMTLICLVSPLLAYFKSVIVFNDNILVYDNELMSQDPRISAKFGNGAVGEKLIRLTISNVRPQDSGVYDCTVNTSPIARNSHKVEVVPPGSLDNAREKVSDFWDTTQPYVFSVSTTSSTGTSVLTSSTAPPKIDSFEFGEKHLTKTVLSEKTVTLPCTIQIDEEFPIIWKITENDFLLYVDTVNIARDERFELETPDNFTRNLLIHKANINDSRSYTCLKESDPPVAIHYTLTVLEGFSPTREVDETTTITSLIPITTDQISTENEKDEKSEYSTQESPTQELEEVDADFESEYDQSIYPTIEEHEEKEEDNQKPEEGEEEVEEEKEIEDVTTGRADEMDYESKDVDIDYKELEDITDLFFNMSTDASEDKDESSSQETGVTGEEESGSVEEEKEEEGERGELEGEADASEGRELEREGEKEGEREELGEPEIADGGKLEGEGEKEGEREELGEPEVADGGKLEGEGEGEEKLESEGESEGELEGKRGSELEGEEESEGEGELEEEGELERKRESESETGEEEESEEGEKYFEEEEEESPEVEATPPLTDEPLETPEESTQDTSTTLSYDDELNSSFVDTTFDSNEPEEVTELTELSPTEQPAENYETSTMSNETYGGLDTYDDISSEEEEDDNSDNKDSEDSTTPSAIEEIVTKEVTESTMSIDIVTTTTTTEKEPDTVFITTTESEGEEGDGEKEEEERAKEESVTVTSETPAEVDTDMIIPKVEEEEEEEEEVNEGEKVEEDKEEEEEEVKEGEKVEEDKEEEEEEGEEEYIIIPVSESDDTDDTSVDKYDVDEEGTEDVVDEEDTEDVEEEVESGEDYPVIIAIPGQDVKAIPEAEVILPCPNEAVSEDITWKDSEKLLFLGSLDLAGVKGLSLSPEGELRLASGISEIKNNKTYTCLVYDYETYEDIPVISYWIQLGEELSEEKPEEEKEELTPSSSTHSPTSTYEFPGLEWQEVAIISNSNVSGRSLTDVLQDGGLNTVFTSDFSCQKNSEITGWETAQLAVKECENEARSVGKLRDSQSVFIILDFMVSLGHSKLYGSTLIYVHNVAVNLSAHVFGPLVPLPKENGYSSVECGSPVYASQKQVLDSLVFCRSSVASTILNLQEDYLFKSRKLPMV